MTNRLAKRRRVLQAILAAPLIVRVPGAAAAGRPVEVWKGPGCGCCNDWIAILGRAGFAVTAHDTGNAAARRTAGIDLKFASCHTAIVDGYALEGHVPVREDSRSRACRSARRAWNRARASNPTRSCCYIAAEPLRRTRRTAS
ncbi:MAG: hypothetical protein BroJett026_06050 [Betaproteobacteria bacterium]|nr:MAG: hypothetical protein BroJett026_06050 [Betaproteobacteria bacterium]